METPNPNPNPTRIPTQQPESPPKTFLTNTHFPCFPCFPCFTSESGFWTRPVSAIKRIREWSELVAGPKWKTFIRSFNRRHHHYTAKFQYDPLSYALNFDEGGYFNGDGDNIGYFPYFSSRFAPVSSSKSSMDLGRGGADPLVSF